MTKKVKILTIIILSILILSVNIQVFAAFAASIGTINNRGTTENDYITTSSIINTSKNYYLGLRIFAK